ncbi:flavoprotein [Luteipulveratus flavus]|uniref:flavoprotein n=1 Tax=Luteipulveratus flavus TaxID=3031728 RepID=UPI003907FB3F
MAKMDPASISSVAQPPHVVVGMCGSTGIALAPLYLMNIAISYPMIDVQVVMSRTASSFVPKSTMEQFAHVVTESPINHITLADWADLIVVIPATADFLARVAAGLADTDLSLLAITHDRPLLIFPNMSSAMWKNPRVQENVSRVRQFGHTVVEPIEGPMFESATRQLTTGHVMPDPDVFAAMVAKKVSG